MFRLHSRSGRGGRRHLGLAVAIAAALLAVAAPAAQAAPFVYVTAGGYSDNVFQFNAGPGGSLAPLSPPAAVVDQSSRGVTVSPDGKSLYVANMGKGEDGDPGGRDEGDSVSQFTIRANGTLSPKSPPAVAAGDGPTDLAVSPDGKNVYAGNRFSGDVSQYDVGPEGELSPKAPATVAGDYAVLAVVVSPNGQSLYVVSGYDDVFGGSNSVLQYDIGPGGALSPKSPPTTATIRGPGAMAITPDGKSAYVTVCCYSSGGVRSDSVHQYHVDSGGKLLPKSPPTVGTGAFTPGDVVVSPDGQSAYVSGGVVSGSASGTKSILQYDIGPDGTLSRKSPFTVNNVNGALAVTADGKSVYVASGGQPGSVSQYDVGEGGQLSPKSSATVAVPSAAGIAVSPLAGPTTKEDCKHGGWREFGFKSKRKCIRFVKRQARQDCRAEREEIGRRDFREKYGRGEHHRCAMRRCIKQAIGAG